MNSKNRQFNTMPTGAHIPGYKGYCPQEKFNVGHTFAMQTHLLSKFAPHLEPVSCTDPRPLTPLKHKLPNITGANKYVSNIAPGYTGFVPSFNFKFGERYRVLCEKGIDSLLTNKENMREKNNKFHEMQSSGNHAHSKLYIRKNSNDLKKDLEIYQSKSSFKLSKQRDAMEPPIPGYKGFVPMLNSTDKGLGCRYRQGTENCLNAFGVDQNKMSPNKYSVQERKTEKLNRVYAKTGMIPLYTGYCPHHRYQIGGTFTNLTRELPACKHDFSSYGEYIRIKLNGQK